MVKDKKNNGRKTESIRVDKLILNEVRGYNKKTSIAIGRFYDMAAKEKLKKIAEE